MQFPELVRKRRMVRNFTPDPVDPDALGRILDLARRAPSAGYTQGQTFIVVTEPAARRAVAQGCGEQIYIDAGYGP